MSVKTVFQKRSCAKGDVVFSEGDVADDAYIVETGTVEIRIQGTDGKAMVIGTVRKGEMFGELALIDGMPRSASAVSLEPTVLLVIPRQHFDAQIEKLPAAMRRVFSIVGARVRRLSSEIANIGSAAPEKPGVP